MKEQLVKFLKKEKALMKYKKNLKTLRSLSIDESLIGVNMPNLIDVAFPWSCTPEGHEYWSEINERWNNCIKIETNGKTVN